MIRPLGNRVGGIGLDQDEDVAAKPKRNNNRIGFDSIAVSCRQCRGTIKFTDQNIARIDHRIQ